MWRRAMAGEVAAAGEFHEAVVTDLFERDVFDGVPIGDTGRQWFLPVAVDLLALGGRFSEYQVAQVVEETDHCLGSSS